MRDIDENFILTFAPNQHIQAILEAQVLLKEEEEQQVFLESRLNIKSPILTIKANTPIYNAHGTTDDEIEINGQIQRSITNKALWQKVTGEALPLTCENQHCAMTSPHNIVGAHMVWDSNKIHTRVGNTFYLVPICNGCNHTIQPIVFNHAVKAVVLVAL